MWGKWCGGNGEMENVNCISTSNFPAALSPAAYFRSLEKRAWQVSREGIFTV